MLRQKLFTDPRLVVKAVQRRFRRDLHQIAITFVVLRQNNQMIVGIAIRRRARNPVIVLLADIKLAAHNRLQTVLFGRIHKMYGTKNIPVIRHRHGRHAQLLGALAQLVHVASAVQH